MADSGPYSLDPNGFIVAAQTPQPVPMPGRVPVQSFGLSRPAPQSGGLFGPAHAALVDQLRGSMQQSNALPSLLQMMIGNPALAQQIGGLQPGNYTPVTPQATRVDWGTRNAQPAPAPAPAPAAPAQRTPSIQDLALGWASQGL